MKVYLLMEFYIEDTNVIGVFARRKLAEKAKNEKEQESDKYRDYEIDEMELQQ